MSRINTYIIVSVALIFAAACKKEPVKTNSIELSAATITVARNGKSLDGSQPKVTVKANTYWRVFIPSDCDWISMQPHAAGQGSSELALVVDPNIFGAKREALLSFEASDDTKALMKVCQNGIDSAPRLTIRSTPSVVWTVKDTVSLLAEGLVEPLAFYYKDGSFTSDSDLPAADSYAVVYPYDKSMSYASGELNVDFKLQQTFDVDTKVNSGMRYGAVSTSREFDLSPMFAAVSANVKGKGIVSSLSYVWGEETVALQLSKPVALSAKAEPLRFTLPAAEMTSCRIGVMDATGDEVLYDIDDFTLEKGAIHEVGITHESASSYTDLNNKAYYGETGTGKVYANCYMISSAGDYKFAAADTRGNAVAFSDVCFVWATTGVWTSSASCVLENLIQDIHSNGNNVYFTIPEDFVPGNVIIAAVSADGTIQYSWHVWTTVDYKDVNVNGVKWMDRNIGASYQFDPKYPDKCQAGRGFYYAWGCKNPIVGMCDGSKTAVIGDSFTMGKGATFYIYNSQVKNTGSWAVMTEYPAGWTGSASDAVKYPMSHFSAEKAPTAGQAIDWPDASNPCPYGYAVMSPTQMNALGTLETMSLVNDASDIYKNVACINSGVVFPSSGYRKADGTLAISGNPDGRYWTNKSSTTLRRYNWTINKSNFKEADSALGVGMSVRCVKINQ